jgi:hypothetical protein
LPGDPLKQELHFLIHIGQSIFSRMLLQMGFNSTRALFQSWVDCPHFWMSRFFTPLIHDTLRIEIFLKENGSLQRLFHGGERIIWFEKIGRMAGIKHSIGGNSST